MASTNLFVQNQQIDKVASRQNTYFGLSPDEVLCFSILITGRCNINCSYCHYYAYQRRSEVNFNLSRENFERYVALIKYTQANYHSNIQVRFSGGEPLSSGKLVYEYASMLYDETGIKPFVLSNGKAIDESVIERSKRSNIRAFVVSLENPFEIDPGSVSPEKIINIINTHNSQELPVIPGVVIVPNDHFKNLVAICDYYYERLNQMPTILNLDFSFFKSPTTNELLALKSNLERLLEKYFSKAPLNLFGYIVPELATGYKQFYIAELDLANTKGISGTDLESDLISLQKGLNEAYFPFFCPNKSCDWHSNCRRLKWVWKNDFNGYCSLKKTISEAYFEFSVKAHHGYSN